METYYFIEKSSVKKGPLKYSDLKSECLNKNDLIWRNDSDIWKSASEYEELNDIIIAEPPLTPKEIKIAEFNSNNSNKIIVNTLVSYIISSVLLGMYPHSTHNPSYLVVGTRVTFSSHNENYRS